MSIETLLAENTAAINRNSDILERLLAGQQAALDKIEAPKASGSKGGKAKDTTALATTATETAAAPEPEAPAAPPAPTVVSDEDVKNAALAWMSKVDPSGTDKAKRTEAAQSLGKILGAFGRTGEKLTGPESKLTDDERKKAKFFIERWAAGKTVDFDAEYDFDGAPDQDVADADPLG